MWIIELSAEKKSESYALPQWPDVTDAVNGRVGKRVVDGIIVKEFLRSPHRAFSHAPQISTYCPYFFWIVRKKPFHEVSQRPSSPTRLVECFSSFLPLLNLIQPSPWWYSVKPLTVSFSFDNNLRERGVAR